MTKRMWIVGLIFSAALVTFTAGTAQAQILGTFRWQTQPYCNVVSLAIVQQGGIFQLNGVDDLCGVGAAPVTGTAAVANSIVTLGFMVMAPSGRPVHISASVFLGTLSGSWSDGEGNGGAFAFNPTTATGSPRPLPTSRVLSATVDAAGSLLSGVGAVSARLNGQAFQVDFNRDISTCSGVASAVTSFNGLDATYMVTAPTLGNPRAIRIAAFDALGTLRPTKFNLVVACP